MSVAPIDARGIATWDVEADVVIAGYGIAGVSAAIEAARAGAEVVVLERTGGWGDYVAGVTECVAEVRALKNIAVAFVPLNVPLGRMTPEEVAIWTRGIEVDGSR